jgi:hypothetical protein
MEPIVTPSRVSQASANFSSASNIANSARAETCAWCRGLPTSRPRWWSRQVEARTCADDHVRTPPAAARSSSAAVSSACSAAAFM